MSLIPQVGNGSGAVSSGEELRLHYPLIATHLGAILQDVPLIEPVKARGTGPLTLLSPFSTLAFVTIFQFVEGMSDSQAVAATRQRADWRAALQLSPLYPGVNPSQMCPFRRGLYQQPAQRAYLDHISRNLVQTGCLTQPLRVSTVEMVEHVCMMNRMEWVREALLRALEALAASQGAWLRQASLPHWFLRYNRRCDHSPARQTLPQLEAAMLRLGADSYHLLYCMAPDAPLDPHSRSILRELEHTWKQHFLVREGEVILREFYCR